MFVASRSFLFACDHHIDNPESESRRIPSSFPKKAGESVYCHPRALENFIANYLPKIEYPFVLVSGDSDLTVPTDVQSQSDLILNHPFLLCWYSQNCVQPSEKLKQLPIGLDFHTLAKGDHLWGSQQTLESQEQAILSLQICEPIKQKKCFGNFQFLMNTRYGLDRKLAIAQIPSALMYYQPFKTTRKSSWGQMIRYRYVISPHGNGLDCHRTWEAIAMGCIPIVKTSPLDPLFEGLPVLIVKEWSDITQELLNTFEPNKTQMNKIRLDYWKSIFNTYKNVVS
jgi:hypothetical protein